MVYYGVLFASECSVIWYGMDFCEEIQIRKKIFPAHIHCEIKLISVFNFNIISNFGSEIAGSWTPCGCSKHTLSLSDES